MTMANTDVQDDDTYIPPNLHAEDDPHCTCPDCTYDFDQQQQAAIDADEDPT
jgi:hypothetical protein